MLFARLAESIAQTFVAEGAAGAALVRIAGKCIRGFDLVNVVTCQITCCIGPDDKSGEDQWKTVATVHDERAA